MNLEHPLKPAIEVASYLIDRLLIPSRLAARFSHELIPLVEAAEEQARGDQCDLNAKGRIFLL